MIGFHRYQCFDVVVAVESREVVPDGFGRLKGREIIDEARVLEVREHSRQPLWTFRMVLFHLMLETDRVGNEGGHGLYTS